MVREWGTGFTTRVYFRTMSMMRRLLLFPILCAFFLIYAVPTVRAEFAETGIATTYTIIDKAAEDGDIVSLTDQKDKLGLSAVAYDEKMFGVYVVHPLIVIRNVGHPSPIVRSGEVMVNVTTVNGDIAIGDYITTSELPGKGQKSTDPTGYVLGIALEPFTQENGTLIDALGKEAAIGKIRVSMGIGPSTPFIQKVSGGFLGGLQYTSSLFLYAVTTSKQTERLIRYILAIIIAVTSIGVSFRSFGRNVTKGIESIGRNPLAKSSIQSMIIINVILIGLVSIGGIVLSLIIISL